MEEAREHLEEIMSAVMADYAITTPEEAEEAIKSAYVDEVKVVDRQVWVRLTVPQEYIEITIKKADYYDYP